MPILLVDCEAGVCVWCSYVSAMVPVKTMKEYELLQDLTVLFCETVDRFVTSILCLHYLIVNLQVSVVQWMQVLYERETVCFIPACK